MPNINQFVNERAVKKKPQAQNEIIVIKVHDSKFRLNPDLIGEIQS